MKVYVYFLGNKQISKQHIYSSSIVDRESSLSKISIGEDLLSVLRPFQFLDPIVLLDVHINIGMIIFEDFVVNDGRFYEQIPDYLDSLNHHPN